jgi:hypothetical protein
MTTRVRKLGAIAAVAMTLMLAACTSSSAPARHPSTGLIVWTSTPAPPTTSSTTTTTTLALAPLCTKGSLDIGPPIDAGATQQVFASFRLTNVGKTTCRLQGYPVLWGTNATGKLVLVHAHDGLGVLNPVAADLAPGASGYFMLQENDFCLSEQPSSPYRVHYRELVAYLPNGAGTAKTPNIAPCGPIEVTPVGVQPLLPGELPPPEPGTTAFLKVSVHLPARNVGGRVLDYIVELANPGSRPIALQPCPGYRESIGVLGSTAAVQRSYELNCRAVGQIGPHKTVRFEMEIPVPKVSKPTEAKFVWLLDTTYHQGWGHPIRVYP